MQIYIGRDGKQYGPLSLDELNSHLESGRIQREDLAWFEGAAGWGPISSVPGVKLPSSETSSRPPQTAADLRSRSIGKASLHSSAPSSDVTLWNPNAAVNWSILLGAPLGSFLHARNWGAMGEHGKERRSLIWFWTTATLTAAAIILPVDERVYGGVWLWSLILWYFISARAQAKHVRQRYGSSYRRKSFIRPLLIALACYVCAIVLSISIYMLIAPGSADVTNVPVERKPASSAAPTSTPTPRPSNDGGQKSVSATRVTVERLTLGASLDSNQRIAAATTTFSPEQTVYASVLTTGMAQAATLSAKWVYSETGELVNASSEVIAPRSPAVTSFHISKPDGWPAGRYQVEIYVDDVLAAKQDFNVSPRRFGDTGDATIVGKCLLEVLGRRYIDGLCPIFMDPDGSFQIRASENDPLTYFATVTIVGKGISDGHWNEESGASHAHTSLGTLHRNGACWENSMAKICAARLVNQHAPFTSSEVQTAVSEKNVGADPADANRSTAECPTTFESGRWSSAENEHGVTMTAADGEKLYIGKSCDVISSRFGTGRWEWANGGVRFLFESCSFGWTHVEPPIEDNDCQFAP